MAHVEGLETLPVELDAAELPRPPEAFRTGASEEVRQDAVDAASIIGVSDVVSGDICAGVSIDWMASLVSGEHLSPHQTGPGL